MNSNFYLKLSDDNLLEKKNSIKLNSSNVFNFDIIENNINYNNIRDLIVRESLNQRKSNSIFIIGPDKSYNSSYLRGDNIHNGLIISLLKEVYKMFITLLNKYSGKIIFKLCIFAYQDEKYYNLITIPLMNDYYDEYIIFNDLLLIKKSIYSFKHLKNILEESNLNISDYVNFTSNYLIVYSAILEIKDDNKLIHRQQYDMYEFCNYFTLDIKLFIEDLISKRISKKFERIINSIGSNYTDYIFILIIQNIYSIDSLPYFNLFKMLQALMLRNDLEGDKFEKCEFCLNSQEVLKKTFKLNQQLFKELSILEDKLENIKKERIDLKNDLLNDKRRSISQKFKSKSIKKGDINTKYDEILIQLEDLYSTSEKSSYFLKRLCNCN